LIYAFLHLYSFIGQQCLRIEEAKRIISDNPKITMTELATRLGYADTSTFFRQFKAKEGVQPSVWKQEYLSV